MSGQVALVCPGVGTLVLPWWPEQLPRSGGGRTWSEVSRPGRTPLLVSDGLSLVEYQVSYLLREVDSTIPVTEHLAMLDALAATDQAMVLMAGDTNRGLFHLSEPSVVEVLHTEAGECTVADVSCTLKQASDAVVNLGPVPTRPNPMPESKKKKVLKGLKGKGSAGV